MKNSLLSISLSSYLFSAGVVVPDDYLITEESDLSYIYSNEHSEILPELKAYQNKILEVYEEEYGFKLDEKLYVGLASSNNQIANGFSTQFPFNSQLFYGGGAMYIDYFSFSSWVKTLIIHETAHNFQANPKENDLSRISHNILGNSSFSMFGFIPLFPFPNVTESSFLFEGNAVMNESRYGNGGRLFSGYALAEVISLAKAGEITAELMYNSTFNFPYGEKFYLVGGFFQQFLVEKFGIKKVNGYFKTYSTQPFPFFTNSIFKKQYGENFENLLAQFVEELKSKHEGFKVTDGRLLARSQLFTPLNSDNATIYTLTGNQKSFNHVLEVNKKTKKIAYQEGSWLEGELFKHNESYYTQSSSATSPAKITIGLFDSAGYLLEDTDSKMVQGYMENGKMVYFDLKTSIESPQVYVDGQFYTQSHSSVYVDKNNLYYFKQEGEKRVLYKNKEALFSYQGHYGFVSDIDSGGNIYFIAPSEHGSSAYCLENGTVKRMTKGDDVIGFKLLNSQEAVVGTIDAKGYGYQAITFTREGGASNKPFAFKIEQSSRLSKKLQANNFLKNTKSRLPSSEYSPIKELQYSSLNQAMGYSSYDGILIDLQANFSDPLMQNSLSALLSHDNKRTVGGLRYDNVAHQLEFGGAFYAVSKGDTLYENEFRKYGADAYLNLPFLAKGYWKGSGTVAYSKAYDNKYREPLTLSLNIGNLKQFGMSKYPNSLNALSLFASTDRENSMLGASYDWSHDMPWQSYVGLKAKYLKSDEVDGLSEKGIELSDTFTSLQSEKATLNVPTFSTKRYAKEVKMAEISVKKVFDVSFYNFSLPLSLQRESVYVKQRLYDIDFTDNLHKQYNESVVGMEMDLLLFHKVEIPMSLEWLYNKDVQDKQNVKILFGGSF